MDALREHFRPEFLNRVDETILFHRSAAATWRHRRHQLAG
jgi:ATP-dependent Clp protease ATP-binding subunit ClpA